MPEPWKSRMNSIDFAMKLLEEAEVAVSPGRGFGETGEGYLRLALVENEQRLQQAVRQIGRCLKTGQSAVTRDRSERPRTDRRPVHSSRREADHGRLRLLREAPDLRRLPGRLSSRRRRSTTRRSRSRRTLIDCPECEQVLVCHWCKTPYDGDAGTKRTHPPRRPRGSAADGGFIHPVAVPRRAWGVMRRTAGPWPSCGRRAHVAARLGGRSAPSGRRSSGRRWSAGRW